MFESYLVSAQKYVFQKEYPGIKVNIFQLVTGLASMTTLPDYPEVSWSESFSLRYGVTYTGT